MSQQAGAGPDTASATSEVDGKLDGKSGDEPVDAARIPAFYGDASSHEEVSTMIHGAPCPSSTTCTAGIGQQANNIQIGHPVHCASVPVPIDVPVL
jgi:hypothetical protein